MLSGDPIEFTAYGLDPRDTIRTNQDPVGDSRFGTIILRAAAGAHPVSFDPIRMRRRQSVFDELGGQEVITGPNITFDPLDPLAAILRARPAWISGMCTRRTRLYRASRDSCLC